jgi:arylsulfatase A-like enzyme
MKAGVKWLEETVSNGKRDNLFLWLDSFDPHEPWDPPQQYADMYPVPEYEGLPITWGGGFTRDWTLAEIRHIRSQYAGTITMVDKWTGLFLEKIEALGLLDNTMIVILSDHGEPLGEHGIIKKIQPWPYDELSRIPLIIRLPDGMASKKRIDSFVGMPDIAPTVLSFLEVKVHSVMQGHNLLPILQGEVGARFGISGFYGRSWSIRNPEWSFYRWLGTKIRAGTKTESELYRYDADWFPPEPSAYHVENDQSEKENLIETEPTIAEDLEVELRTFVEGLTPSLGDLTAQNYMKRKMGPAK